MKHWYKQNQLWKKKKVFRKLPTDIVYTQFTHLHKWFTYGTVNTKHRWHICRRLRAQASAKGSSPRGTTIQPRPFYKMPVIPDVSSGGLISGNTRSPLQGVAWQVSAIFVQTTSSTGKQGTLLTVNVYVTVYWLDKWTVYIVQKTKGLWRKRIADLRKNLEAKSGQAWWWPPWRYDTWHSHVVTLYRFMCYVRPSRWFPVRYPGRKDRQMIDLRSQHLI